MVLFTPQTFVTIESEGFHEQSGWSRLLVSA